MAGSRAQGRRSRRSGSAWREQRRGTCTCYGTSRRAPSRADLKDDGKAGRWFSPLELYVPPKLGGVPVSQIDQEDIHDTLRPIRHTKADTALKAMNRLGLCLKHAAALASTSTCRLPALLGQQKHKVQHVPALPWQELPGFYARLADGTITHLACGC